MKKIFFLMVLLAGNLLAAPAYAETVEGMIVSMDAKNGLVKVGSGTDAAGGVEISVKDFIKVNGTAPLDDLDLGKKVSMSVRKDAKGGWNMTALKKPEALVPPPVSDEDGRFLKTKGKPKETAYSGEARRKLAELRIK